MLKATNNKHCKSNEGGGTDQIIVKVINHRNTECIALYFTVNYKIQGALQKTKLVKFSQTHKCWYAPLSKENYATIAAAVKGLAELDNNVLPNYLTEKKKVIAVNQSLQIPKSKQLKKTKEPIRVTQQTVIAKKEFISSVNAHILPAMEQYLKLKGYSPSTQKTYLNEVGVFLKTIKQHAADEFTTKRLKDYLYYCSQTLQLSENTLHSRMNALKFYYEQVLKKEKLFWEIPRPKKRLQLPHFFNQDEIAAIIKSADNLKHKTMLMLAYSSGLRASEVVAIQSKNIDSKRMCILIVQAKGKKDRMVSLSPLLLVMLREYWKSYTPNKGGYLFEGQNKNEPYSTRSIQLVLAAAKAKAGILKPGSIHALRHSFATHLLDRGTDVTMIMKLLGHNDIKTTLRYLHLTNRDILQVVSPLDSLKLD